jgi:hypothetical protein
MSWNKFTVKNKKPEAIRENTRFRIASGYAHCNDYQVLI